MLILKIQNDQSHEIHDRFHDKEAVKCQRKEDEMHEDDDPNEEDTTGKAKVETSAVLFKGCLGDHPRKKGDTGEERHAPDSKKSKSYSSDVMRWRLSRSLLLTRPTIALRTSRRPSSTHFGEELSSNDYLRNLSENDFRVTVQSSC